MLFVWSIHELKSVQLEAPIFPLISLTDYRPDPLPKKLTKSMCLASGIYTYTHIYEPGSCKLKISPEGNQSEQ